MHQDERVRIFMDTIPVLIWSSDAEGNWLYANRVWVEFTGASAEAELGRGWTERVHPEDVDHRDAVLAAHTGTREPFRIEFRMRRRDGDWRWMLCAGLPRFDAGGAFMGFIGSCTDITENKEVERQRLQNLEERAAVMQELHHRVKNNAQVFASLLGVQASRAADPAVRTALRAAAARAGAMTFAQQQIWDAGSSARFDLTALIRRIVRAQPPSDVEIAVAAPDTVHAPLATAVPLGLIVHELLTNALQHGFPGGRRGGVTVALSREAGGTLRLGVTDDGVGMVEAAESAATRSAGLTIVRSLARQLGATLTTERAVGTAVTLTLRPPPEPTRA